MATKDLQTLNLKFDQVMFNIFIFTFKGNFEVTRFLSRIFCLRGKSILKNIFEPRGGEKKIFRPSRGIRGHVPPENFENIVFKIG